jgi:xanthine dehydrogenase small subunit
LIRFILNEKEVAVDLPPGMVLLDFIRYHQYLTGTKIGCREGDCGACTVLIGDLKDERLQYESMTSCLMPLGNAHGKHVVTVEGINFAGLNPIQQAMADEGATQCGFCTPGFVMSLAGLCLSRHTPSNEHAIAAIDGNICRCTGYKSIERAAAKVVGLLKERKDGDPVLFAADQEILPRYFSSIKDRLLALKNEHPHNNPDEFATRLVGGGTDLYVQQHEAMVHSNIHFLFDQPLLNGIRKEGSKCVIGSSATITDMKTSPVIRNIFPSFDKYAWLVSSTPIRNMATIAGNFINASPIGDFTIFFLALDAQLVLSDGKKQRTIPLRSLYKGYKQLDKQPDERVESIWFEIPGADTTFHFEKVSKRTNLDIASVNSAILIKTKGDMIIEGSISAGGVGPVPMYLRKASAFIAGKKIDDEMIQSLIEIAESEVSPISDARGSAEYKKLLLRQLIKAHFLELFEKYLDIDRLIKSM